MSGYPGFRTSPARRGLSSMIVIGFTMVIFICFARLIYMLKEGAFMASHFHRRGILANVADGGAAVGLNVLDRLFGDPTSEPFKSLTEEGNYKDRVFDIYPKGAFPIKCLDELVAKYPGCSLEVKARVFYLQPFGECFEPGIMTQIPKEKIGVLEVSSSASFASPKYKQIVRERRWVKITCQALPVFSRFSLFLQEANKTSTPKKYDKLDYSKEWNRIAVSEAGTADGEPLVVANGATGPFGDFKKRGWVFLGGGEKPQQAILLGLAGGKTKIGEAHHLFPDIFQNNGYRSEAFYGKSWADLIPELIPDSEENKSINRDKAHPVYKEENKWYEDMTVGFFDSGHCKELCDIPELGSLLAYIDEVCNCKGGGGSGGGGGSATPPLSSAIHIFGAADGVGECDTTPTPPGPGNIVMGNVFRAYAQIGVFQFYVPTESGGRPGGGWDITGFWPFLGEDSLVSFFEPLLQKWNKDSQNDTKSNQHNPLAYAFWIGEQFYKYNPKNGSYDSNKMIQAGYDVKHAFMHYANLMSFMIFDPYANSSSLRAKLWEAKIAPKTLDPDWGKDEECKWGSVLPTKDKAKGLIEREERDFTKSLNNFFLPLKYFTIRETVRYKGESAQKDFEALFKEHIKGGELDYGKFIVVLGDVNLPDIDTVKKGGVICATGKISIGKIGPASDTASSMDDRCRKLLTIISLGGGITLRGGPVNAELVCLGSPDDKSMERGAGKTPMPFNGAIQGTVDLQSKVEVTGSLACRELPPDQVAKKGGSITYNPALSPENEAGYLSNNQAFCINLMPKIEEWEVKAE